MTASPLMVVQDLVKHFPGRSGALGRRHTMVHAVCGVSFTIAEGETLGLVGESGCGKSTTARLLIGMIPATSGSARFDDKEIVGASPSELRAIRRRLQIVFQDPFGSLDPRMSVGASIAEPLKSHHRFRGGGWDRVRDLMATVELDPQDLGRYPHEFSGGQRQRVGIARALALQPELVLLDEPVSSLDVSIQAGVINLLADLQERLGVSYLFIAHDLSVVHHLCHRVAVMYLGKVVEMGERASVYRHPAHPYTQSLLSAIPSPDPVVEHSRQRIVLQGEPPSALDPPSGCRFRTRCWKAQARCADEEPALVDRGQGHPVACHFADTTVRL